MYMCYIMGREWHLLGGTISSDKFMSQMEQQVNSLEMGNCDIMYYAFNGNTLYLVNLVYIFCAQKLYDWKLYHSYHVSNHEIQIPTKPSIWHTRMARTMQLYTSLSRYIIIIKV